MNRRWCLRLMIGGLAGTVAPGLIAVGNAISEAAPSGLRSALEERYRLSDIEFEHSQRQGAVVRRGVVLRLQTDGVPANPLRVIRPVRWSPRDHAPAWPRHLRNYARFTVPKEGAPVAEPATFTLPRGTRVVLLEMKIARDAVRLFTHTAEPVPGQSGRAQYGCTEFVFRLDPDVIRRAEVATAERTIERWLARAA